MSGAGNTAPVPGPDTAKAVVSDTKDTSSSLKDQQKPAATLEEDDEFEDFPAEGKIYLTCRFRPPPS